MQRSIRIDLGTLAGLVLLYVMSIANDPEKRTDAVVTSCLGWVNLCVLGLFTLLLLLELLLSL